MTHRNCLKIAATVIAGLIVGLGCDDKSKNNATSNGGTPAVAKSKIVKADGKPVVVGFAQVGAESAWRTANSKSVKDEAAARGVDLKFTDAQQKQENQLKAINDFIDQKVDVILVAPVVTTGWGPVFQKAKDAGIPIIMSDRKADVPEDHYVTFIGSDFIEEGKRAGDWLNKKMNGKAVIAELQGTVGSDPANDRKKGFADAIAGSPDMKIIKSQSGDFEKAKGKAVMEAFLKSPEGNQINAVFAHNDDMAIGAIQAIKENGKKPGVDIIVVSIDGVRDAFVAMAKGELNCTVECNPLIGPQLFDAVEKVIKGESLPKRIKVEEGVFDQSQAEKELPNRKY